MNYNDEWDRKWAISFLKRYKGKDTIINGVNTPWDTRDIKDYYSSYGADVERAETYNPLERNGNITIPFRKVKIGKYWEEDKETDYVQFTDTSFKTLLYIKDETIRKHKDKVTWNKTNIRYPREVPWKGYTLEECTTIWNSYIEIPKTDIEVWNRKGEKGNWVWEKNT